MVPNTEQSKDVQELSPHNFAEAKAENFTKKLSAYSIINLDFGDPTLYEEYWKKMEGKCEIVIPSWRSVSYFSDTRNFCWFLEPELETQIGRLHSLVGNAVMEDRHIVVGAGSSQLITAAFYALCPQDTPEPVSVVSAVPYYSPYPAMADHLKSRLYKWAGDARAFGDEKPYIEIVCSPNNPDGSIKQPVVNRIGGTVIHDLAYYWPQYTPITSPADHDMMLFTASKATGHAGSRIGWALVKDEAVARKMVKFLEINSIGVSKDAQLRVAKILQFVCESCENVGQESVFDYGRRCMKERWERLRDVIEGNGVLRAPEFPEKFCAFFKEAMRAQPAFAWLECSGEEIEDCETFLREHYKIVTRNGKWFGSSGKYVRVSMLSEDETFQCLLNRLAGAISSEE